MSDEASPASPKLSNPQEPASSNPSRTANAGRFYRVNSSRSSFVELWRDTRSPVVLIAWLTKLLQIKLPGSVNDPNVVSLLPFMMAGERCELPSEASQKFEPILRELTDLGFGPAVYFEINDVFHHSRAFYAVLLHREGRSIARIQLRTEGVQKSKSHLFSEFISAFSGGRFLWSSSARAQMLPPALCRLNYKYKTTTSQLWVSHRQEMGACGEFMVTMRSKDEMLGVLERHHECVRDFNLQRGVFSSMRGEDLAQAQALDKTFEQAHSGQMRHPEIMAHLDRLQKKQTNWSNAILVLIVSIGLFIGAGATSSGLDWELLLMILGILLVHESGHYLAMKIFNYRNVRMFFIPFFGAAVSGQNYSAPGWKKVIVSLMGPLPGIFLGGALGVVGLIKGNELLTKVAMLTIILNGFQLLPVLPLDGGRVMHAVLFSRHYSLDIIFRLLAAAALVGLGMLSQDKFFLYLGIFMLVTVPTAYKSAKIATELRSQGFGRPGSEPDTSAIQPGPSAPVSATALVNEEHSIPQPIAEAIIDRVKQRFPRLKNAKQSAVLTLQVYETLVTRPPGIKASIGFVFLHGASLFAAFVLLALLIIPQRPDLFSKAFRMDEPKYAIIPETMVKWDGSSASPDISSKAVTREHDTIIATFSMVADTRSLFNNLKHKTPAPTSMVMFGQSLLLSVRATDAPARMDLFTELETKTQDVFVDSPSGSQTSMSLTCSASSYADAQVIEEELNRFFEIPTSLYLIPPWADDDLDQRSNEQRGNHELARETYHKLQGTQVHGAQELKPLREGMSRASRRNDRDEYRRLSEQLLELKNKLRMRELERKRDKAEGPLQRKVADGYIACGIAAQQSRKEETATRPAAGSTASSEQELDEDFEYAEAEKELKESQDCLRANLGPMLGQLELLPDGSQPPASMLRYSPNYGFCQSLRKTLSIQVTFEDVLHGAPAMLKWLKKRGCHNFKYDFTSTGNSEVD